MSERGRWVWMVMARTVRGLPPLLLAGVALGTVACGFLGIAPRPPENTNTSNGSSGSQASAQNASSEQDVVPEWTGIYGSTFGRLVFKETTRGHWSGTYPAGTLTCEGVKRDLACEWADDTGGGHAKFHWDSANHMSGTFGNGASDSDQGKWVLTWPAPGAEIVPAPEVAGSCTRNGECGDGMRCMDTDETPYYTKTCVRAFATKCGGDQDCNNGSIIVLRCVKRICVSGK